MRVKSSGDAELEAFNQWTLSFIDGADYNITIPEYMLTDIVSNT